MKRALFLVFSFILSITAYSQHTLDQVTANMKWRNIGPANQGGRIVDIEALDNDFTKVLIATGSGGVFKSVNAGNSWTPIFDDYETASIGDIAVNQQNPNIIWVGTGEANNRNSVSWGNGVYRSTDGGDTFTHLGLENTHAIARVVLNPKDEDEACVCATGHLWGYSGDRGLFVTGDGGKTWDKMTNGLPDDGKTGCTDLIVDPRNPRVMYAAMYHRRRMPWHFHSGGENGGIYKTTNGGRSWTKLTNGLPAGPTGRIGLAISRSNPDIVMALVEAEQTDDLSKPGSGVYRSEDGGKSWTYVNTYNNRPFYYSQIRINPIDDQRVYLLTTRFMVSEDGGKTIRDGSEDQEIHGDFHAMWLDPTNKDRYYMGADKGISLTHDHGAHFFLLDNLAIAQFYRIGYDMREPYYVYGGLQDNGMYGIASFSRDARGILTDHAWKLHWGDGQFVFSDPTNWRDVFTSAENGSFFHYDPVTHRQTRISPTSESIVNYKQVKESLPEGEELEIRYNWTAPYRMSPHDPNTLFAAGNYVFKSTDKGHSWKIISPDLSTNHPRKSKDGLSGGLTPDNTGAETHCAASTLSISPIAEDVIWVGTDDGNVQITQNGGGQWKNVRSAIPDVPDSLWVSRIEASHFDQATAYVTFDGHRSDNFGTWVFKTTDFGKNWTSLKANLPAGEVVRVIREDHKNPNLLFIGTETGVWFTIDGGQRWQRLKNNMPTVSVYDLKIHPRDNDLIVGTHGRSIWILDDISSLQEMTPQALDSDGHLFEQRQATLWENVSRGGQRGHFWFAGDNPETIVNTSSVPRAEFENRARVTFYLGETDEKAELIISNLRGNKQRTVTLDEAAPGIHRYLWDLEFDVKPYTAEQEAELDKMFQNYIAELGSNSLRRAYRRFQEADNVYDKRRIVQGVTTGFFKLDIPEEYRLSKAGPGVYKVMLKIGDKTHTQTLEVREDPILKE
jgi:photosystem II stability/assembly factor-like uncharacterized protein